MTATPHEHDWTQHLIERQEQQAIEREITYKGRSKDLTTDREYAEMARYYEEQKKEKIMENAVVLHKEQNIINLEDYTMPVERLISQVQLIQQVMAKTMKDGEHFGIIPGCKKPSLLKPGAEKLSLTFRLAPEYKITKTDLPNGHREYEIITTLLHIPTGQQIAQGVGSCSTLEAKYKFRTGEGVVTDIPVPKEYWDNRDLSVLKKLANNAGIEGDKFGTKKDSSGKWMISTFGEKVEHDNPADYYNTVLKMAKKRSHVDAILTATAASDIFTQDIEDLPHTDVAIPQSGKPDAPTHDFSPIKSETNATALPPKTSKPVSNKPATKADVNRILQWGQSKKLTDAEIINFVDWYKIKKSEPERITQSGALDLFSHIDKYYAEFTESKLEPAYEPEFVMPEREPEDIEV